MRIKTLLLFTALSAVMLHAFLSHQHTPRYGSHAWYDGLFGYDGSYDQTELYVPDYVMEHLTSLHRAIGETGVSMIQPEGYTRTTKFAGFCRDIDTGMRVENIPESFYQNKAEIDKYISAAANNPNSAVIIKYRKNFRFNNYDAMLICISNTMLMHDSIYMIYGDESFHVNMQGICKTYDKAAEKEILNTFLTSCYDKTKT